MNLKDRVAIITGASSGIGREIALTLARLGASVVINYCSSTEKAVKIRDELKVENLDAEVFQADVSIFKDALELIDYTIEKYGRLDILVNNAGVNADNLILRMSEADFDKVMNINLKGTWNCSKHASKYMAKQRFGRIINITSVVGLIGNAGQSNYAASKAGIIGLTKALAKELAKRNITVNAIAPGFIKTDMTETLKEEWVLEIEKNIPVGRLGEASDVAKLVAFLADAETNYITGQVINVDGGLVM
ncbi:MAG: 3-oxoacyl-[acyl-carrier-protein] reductase [Bacilli bacterium]|nr:3-oxoacyl-[acyl-carrier-protein] reductase [Bacilli bacterium]